LVLRLVVPLTSSRPKRRWTGFEVHHDGQLITIFSAPNYCDRMDNKGALIRFGADMIPHFTCFEAVPHPDVPSYVHPGIFY
jgi:hypothetical protein